MCRVCEVLGSRGRVGWQGESLRIVEELLSWIDMHAAALWRVTDRRSRGERTSDLTSTDKLILVIVYM